MGDATGCSIPGCSRRLRARGWCATHYRRWQVHGDPLMTLRPTWGLPIEERFWAKVDADGDCWEWTAFRHPEGYGRFGVATGISVQAHRWGWEHLVGSIPDGMQLDHMCRNRGCVNPDHLRVVTLIENVLLGEGPPARNARRTHCPAGHEYTEPNTKIYARPGGKPSRYCRACWGAGYADPQEVAPDAAAA